MAYRTSNKKSTEAATAPSLGSLVGNNAPTVVEKLNAPKAEDAAEQKAPEQKQPVEDNKPRIEKTLPRIIRNSSRISRIYWALTAWLEEYKRELTATKMPQYFNSKCNKCSNR